MRERGERSGAAERSSALFESQRTQAEAGQEQAAQKRRRRSRDVVVERERRDLASIAHEGVHRSWIGYNLAGVAHEGDSRGWIGYNRSATKELNRELRGTWEHTTHLW